MPENKSGEIGNVTSFVVYWLPFFDSALNEAKQNLKLQDKMLKQQEKIYEVLPVLNINNKNSLVG